MTVNGSTENVARRNAAASGGEAVAHSKAPKREPNVATDHLEDKEGSEASGSEASGSSGNDSQHSSSPELSSSQAGSEVIVQSGEAVDLPIFNAKLDKPMMEVVAGSNTWYQATVLQSTSNKIRVLFPATTEGKRDQKEWVLRTSSRIWRGSMSSREWKYLSKGAWAPRTKSKGRSRGGRKNRGGSSARGRAGSSSHAATGSGTPGAAASADFSSRGGSGGEEPDVASPRKRHHDEDAEPSGRKRVRLSDTEDGLAKQRPQDPLAAWFSHHFALLDKAGLLGSNYASGAPEGGFMLPGQPHQARDVPSDTSARPAHGGAQTGSRRPDSTSQTAAATQGERSGSQHGVGPSPLSGVHARQGSGAALLPQKSVLAPAGGGGALGNGRSGDGVVKVSVASNASAKGVQRSEKDKQARSPADRVGTS